MVVCPLHPTKRTYPNRLTPFPAALYTATYQRVFSQEHISELTVEDPAEAFEDLRDRNDLKMILGLKRFMEEGFGTNGSSKGGGVGPIRRTKSSSGAGKMGPPVNKAWAEKWRVQLKIAGVGHRSCGGFQSLTLLVPQRQFYRLVEMLQLLNLDPLDTKAFKAFRIQVKERLYRFNYVSASLSPQGRSVTSHLSAGDARAAGEARTPGQT